MNVNNSSLPKHNIIQLPNGTTQIIPAELQQQLAAAAAAAGHSISNQIQRPHIINASPGQVRHSAPGQPMVIPNSTGGVTQLPGGPPGQNLQATLQASQALILQQQQQLAAVQQQQLAMQHQQHIQAQQAQQQQQQQIIQQQHQHGGQHGQHTQHATPGGNSHDFDRRVADTSASRVSPLV